jgi:hypothetical protein
VDGASLVVALVVAQRDDPAPGVLIGVGGYVLGAPIVHFAHGRVDTGFGSLGMRVGLPLVTGLVGLAVGSGDNGSAHSGAAYGAAVGAAFGAIVGALGAIIIDASVLAYRPPSHDYAATHPGPGSLAIGFASSGSTRAVSVSGTF